jgi:hypothetical protein
MGSDSFRGLIASLFLIAFLIGYNLILINIMKTKIENCHEMLGFIAQTLNLKIMVCLLYFVSNSIMCLSYKSQFEKEILITGIFSLATLGLINLLHYSGMFTMSSQASLIAFNSITILFFILVYTFGKLNNLITDGE